MNLKLENIFARLYNSIRKNKGQHPTEQAKPKEWVVCSSCQYRGTLEEFLQIDRDDTRCPKCREDVSIFEL